MDDAYKKLDYDLKRDWVSELKFNQLLVNEFHEIKEKDWRYFLYKYSLKYYEVYYTDWLDEAFIFIEEELNDPKNRDLLKDELIEIKKEIRYTAGENIFSLSAIAEAVNRLLYEEPLSKNCVRKFFNHILFAYSCQLYENEFLNREDNVLCNWFEKLKKGNKNFEEN